MAKGRTATYKIQCVTDGRIFNNFKNVVIFIT